MTGGRYPYLLDTNVFIQAKDRPYNFDFWNWVVEQNHAGKVASVLAVATELQRGKDELVGWSKAQGSRFFLGPDQAVMAKFHVVSNWAQASCDQGNYEQGAVNTFLKAADSYLIAHALAHGGTVVTDEKLDDPPVKTRIKIPNACKARDVQCMSPREMFHKARCSIRKV